MSALYPQDVRAAVAAQVLTVGSPLRASVDLYEFIRSGTHSPVHGEVAVGIPSTIPLAENRQRPAEGTHATTDVRVLHAWQVKSPADRVTSFDQGVALANRVRNALVARGWFANLVLVWSRSDHTAGPDGWLWFEHTFTAHHALPLQ